ncbi:Hypothetical protein A7982_07876 [Minicystis rosea]|nr:Hypothetical protein A7982_07876 [Minicystis rosea]
MQTAYFLLLEAHLSSRASSYFIALLFWLVGLLFGLRLGHGRRFGGVLAAGLAGYHAAHRLATSAPFHPALYVVVALGSILSGAASGLFFRVVARRYRPIRSLLFHENNGFVLGLAVALRGATHFGGALLAYGPVLTAGVLATLVLAFARAERQSSSSS